MKIINMGKMREDDEKVNDEEDKDERKDDNENIW